MDFLVLEFVPKVVYKLPGSVGGIKLHGRAKCMELGVGIYPFKVGKESYDNTTNKQLFTKCTEKS